MTTQQKALQDCITAMEKLLSAVKIDRHDTEDWPKDSRESLEQVKIALTQAKQALDQFVDANKMVQAKGEAIPHSGADEKPPVFGRRWKIAADGFGLQRDDLNGRYVDIDDALSVLHSAHPQASEPVGINGLTQAETDANKMVQAQADNHAKTYARNLCLHMQNKFYPDVAQFEPQEDLLGMLTQIDNMVEGLVHPQASEPAGCTWTQQDDEHMPGTWASSCGELWSFNDGGPKENRVSYCHHCGGKVNLTAAPEAK
jgi:hypothetical protein